MPRAPALRPTAERTREAVFDILEHARAMTAPSAAQVLDVFAGTGALGFEDAALDALRRRFADFRLLEDHPIERDAARQVLRRLRRNTEFEGFLDRLGPAGPEHTDRRRGP